MFGNSHIGVLGFSPVMMQGAGNRFSDLVCVAVAQGSTLNRLNRA